MHASNNAASGVLIAVVVLAVVILAGGCPEFPRGELHYETGTGEKPCTDEDGDRFSSCQNDCNDTDKQVNPDQTAFFPSSSNGSFDYNCDGIDEPELTELVSCAEVDAGSGCTGAGWRDEIPECGQSAVHYECELTGKKCTEKAGGDRTQACR